MRAEIIGAWASEQRIKTQKFGHPHHRQQLKARRQTRHPELAPSFEGRKLLQETGKQTPEYTGWASARMLTTATRNAAGITI